MVAGQNLLPAPLSSFIGRAREVVAVKRQLEQSRLVTLTGAGGCGKTRLALAVADEMVGTYGDGVWLVELASLANPLLVAQVVASTFGVREGPLIAEAERALGRASS